MPVRVGLTGRWLVCLALVGGCTWTSDQDLYPPLDAEPPRVVGSIPQDGWIQVPSGMELRVWFSEPVDPASVDRGSIYLYTGQELVALRYLVGQEQDGRGLVVLRPERPLLRGVEYILHIRDGVTDLLGNPLHHEVEIRFETQR